MDNGSTFGDELKSIETEVSVDVGKILDLAKSATRPKSEQARPRTVESTQPTSDKQNDDLQRQATESLEQKPQKTSKPKRADIAPDPLEPRENVTTRLTRRTNERLTDAALRQKLKKLKPDTRQDIVEAALIEWLNTHATT